MTYLLEISNDISYDSVYKTSALNICIMQNIFICVSIIPTVYIWYKYLLVKNVLVLVCLQI